MLQIVEAVSSDHFEFIRELFGEFIAWDTQVTASLGFDPNVLLEYQYHDGVIELPGEFAPPDGLLLLALYNGEAAGCVGLKRLDSHVCEIKRLYVRPMVRGKRVGRTLMETLLRVARESGYRCAQIETVTFMPEAIALYHSLGFKDIEAYYEIPDVFKPITIFMELTLY